MADDGCFALAPSHEDNPFSFHDRADAHRNRFAGNVFFAKKIAGGIGDGDVVERNQTGARIETRTRLIEADVSRAPDAQKLQIETTRCLYFGFVFLAKFTDFFFFNCSIGNVDVFGENINVVKKVFLHEADVTLEGVGLHRKILVEVESDDVFETQTVFVVHPHEFAINARGRRTRCQAEDAHFTFCRFGFYQIGNFLGNCF